MCLCSVLSNSVLLFERWGLALVEERRRNRSQILSQGLGILAGSPFLHQSP